MRHKRPMKTYWKLNRIYVENALAIDKSLSLEADQSHYLTNVLRKKEEDLIRVFNAKSGEYLARIIKPHKKQTIVAPIEKLRGALNDAPQITLILPPLKKDKFDWVIQKSVELGVTDFQFVNTEHCDVQKIKKDRLEAQIVQAAEQCERLDIPHIYDVKPLIQVLDEKPIFVAIEREERAKSILHALKEHKNGDNIAFLIGPAGGFSQAEKEMLLARDNVIPVSLGERILRVETAVSYVLSIFDAAQNCHN